MKNTHRAKNTFIGLAVILAVIVFGLTNCSSPGGGGGGGDGGGGVGGGGTGGTGSGGSIVINRADIIITAPANGVSPKTTANNSGGTENFTIGAISWSPANNPFLGNAVYTASVTLTANSNYTFTGLSSATINGQNAAVSNNTGSAVTVSHTFPATNAKIVTKIAIKTQPTLSYKENDKLDLAGLVVTLTHDDTTTEDVAAADFAAKNVTANPAVGTSLVYPTYNGQSVEITYGNLTCTTNNLTVVELVQAVWARTVSAGNDISRFNAVAVDSSGDVYAAGYQYGNGTYTYSSGVSVQGTSSNYNIVLVKYNSGGTALWARTVSAGDKQSVFNAVAVDSSSNVYAAGYQYGNGTYTYSSGVSVQGTSSNYNIVLVKYNSGGTALWARTVSAGDKQSVFNAVAVDSSGNVYAAGYQIGTGTYTYGTGISAQGAVSGNVVLVKYNSSGMAQWALTVSKWANGTASYQYDTRDSAFNAVAVDSSGNVYAAGYQTGDGTYTYNSYGGYAVASAKGISFSINNDSVVGDKNVVLVKYNSDGTAQWARTVSKWVKDTYPYDISESEFLAVAVDSSDNVYAAGYQRGNGTYTYGSYNAQGSGNQYQYYTKVLIKYDPSGSVRWVRTVSNDGSIWRGVAVDSFSNVYAAGGSLNNFPNPKGLIKYDYSNGTEQWTRKAAGRDSFFNDQPQFNAVAVDSSGNVYAAGYQKGDRTYTYSPGVSVQGTSGANNVVVLVKYKE